MYRALLVPLDGAPLSEHADRIYGTARSRGRSKRSRLRIRNEEDAMQTCTQVASTTAFAYPNSGDSTAKALRFVG
jgi:hypothetical protein